LGVIPESANSIESKPWSTAVEINGHTVEFKTGTGADVTAIPDKTFKTLNVHNLQPSKKITKCCSRNSLNVIEKFSCEFLRKGVKLTKTCMSFKDSANRFFGRPAIEKLETAKHIAKL
jgi:hypothetical protein